MPDAIVFNQQGNRAPAPRRLIGALAAGTVIGNGASAFERIYVAGLAKIRIIFKLASVTGTATGTIHPLLSNATKVDTTGTRAVVSAPAGVTTTDTTEKKVELDLCGEQYIDFEISMSAAGADTATVTHVEVFGQPV